MASGTYEWWLCADTGEPIALLDGYESFAYTLVQHNIGTCQVVIPAKSLDLEEIWQKNDGYLEARGDRKLAVWRQAPGAAKKLENVYLLQDLKVGADATGIDKVILIGADGNLLIKWRFVQPGPYENTTYVTKNGCADDVCKALVREALTSASYKLGRAIDSAYFGVQIDSSLGASFKKTYAYRMLYDALDAACKTSKGRGKTIFWGVVPDLAAPYQRYQFQTYLDQIGIDRRAAITLSRANNNLAEPQYTWSNIDSYNYVAALGGNYGALDNPYYRYSYAYRDTARIAASVYGLREKCIDDGDAGWDDMDKNASEELEACQPVQNFTCKLVDNETMKYGLQWNFGDRVTAEYMGMAFEPRVVKVTVEVRKGETIMAELSVPTASNPEAE